MINFSNSQGILKAVAISITALNTHVIDNLKCIHPFTSIPTIMALEANDLIGSDTMSIKDGIISFEIKGDWNLGSLPVKGMRLRFTDNLHQELLPDLFDPDTTGTLPPERYEFILEATVEEVTNWYEKTLEIEYIKPSEQTIDDVVRPIYIFDHTEYYKNKWPEVKTITSLACTPIY